MTRLPLRRRAAILAAAATTLVLAACGSTSTGSSHATTASTGAGSLASKSPAQIVAASQRALKSADGFVLSGALHQGKSVMKLRIVDRGTSTFELQIKRQQQVASIIVASKAAYVRANKSFWLSNGSGAAAAQYSNRWIQFPSGASRQLTSQFGEFAPTTLARCLGEDHGKLTKTGTTTVGGKAAVVIHDAGDVPGGGPGDLVVASSGPAYPLRLTSTGPTRAGGKIDVCNTGKADNVEGAMTLGNFNDPPPITIPKSPLKITSGTGSSV